MDDDQSLATFAINANQEHLQDLFDVAEELDQLTELLLQEDIPMDAWKSMESIRKYIDELTYRAILIPSFIHEMVPDTHISMKIPKEVVDD